MAKKTLHQKYIDSLDFSIPELSDDQYKEILEYQRGLVVAIIGPEDAWTDKQRVLVDRAWGDTLPTLNHGEMLWRLKRDKERTAAKGGAKPKTFRQRLTKSDGLYTRALGIRL